MDRTASRGPRPRRPAWPAADARAVVERLEERRLLAVFYVTSAADAGPDSLRDAIVRANADPDPDTIYLRLAGGSVAAPRYVELASRLPTLTQPTGLFVVPPYTPTAVGIRPAAGLEGQFDGLTVASTVRVEGLQIRGSATASWSNRPAGRPSARPTRGT